MSSLCFFLISCRPSVLQTSDKTLVGQNNLLQGQQLETSVCSHNKALTVK